MIEKECGAALVLVYLNGRRVAALHHAHDGGEAYMRPVLRRAVAYAKTHYGSGEIVDVLLSEPEMCRLGENPAAYAGKHAVRHAYYVVVTTIAEEARKDYSVRALHRGVGEAELPEFSNDLPSAAKTIA